MSRSGYIDDDSGWEMLKYRGQVASATRGKRGQAFLKALLKALDDMPSKRLIAGSLKTPKGEVCAIGCLMDQRRELPEPVDWFEPAKLSERLDIAEPLAREVVFMNDEYAFTVESPESRWCRMRAWVASQINEEH